jgi:uncharacterized short protein YbdD (DUF466 family)
MRRLRARLREVAAVLRAIIGAPDYERYAAHMRRRHPGAALLSPAEFIARRHAERSERPGGRCC